jgi:DNA-binding MarR family transcriptional regulator
MVATEDREAASEQEPGRLAPEELDAWAPLSGVLMRLPAALDAQLQRDAGISHVEYLVLATLSQAPARELVMSDLAGLVNCSLSRLSQVATRLEKQDWVRRAPCAHNGRYTRATLTDAGWDKAVATAPLHTNAVRNLVIEPLTAAQTKHLSGISRRILNRVNSVAAVPPSPPHQPSLHSG